MRKQPRQTRSRATVAAIVEAGAQVLGRGGWGAFNTNVVADVAGVSIGTVYQYFPDKLALVDAIRHRHFDEVLAAIAIVDDHDMPLSERVKELVEGLVIVHGDAPSLHRALLEDAPRTNDAREEDEAFERAYVRAFECLIACGRRRPTHASVAAQVFASAVEGVVHDAARKRLLRSRALRAELTDTLLSALGE